MDDDDAGAIIVSLNAVVVNGIPICVIVAAFDAMRDVAILYVAAVT